MATESFDWVIVEDNGISERFETRDEALDALSEYDSGATVEWSPESDFPEID